MAEAVEQERQAERGGQAPPMRRVNRESELPLSFAQQRLWFLHQLEPESAAYNVPRAVRIKGRLDSAALNQALKEIGRRHETLRTRFIARDGQPMQVIDECWKAGIILWDLSGLDACEREEEAGRIIREDAGHPFDLELGPVLRAGLLRLFDGDYVLALSLHHIVSDGWSTGLLINEFIRIYEAFRAGISSPLRDLQAQYADYAVWQREQLQGEVLNEQLDYWRRTLDKVPILKLPTDLPRTAKRSHRGKSIQFKLPAEFTLELRRRCRSEGVTPFMILLTGLQITLGRYAGQDDGAVGTLIASRNRLETEELIGFFINQLVLRMDLSGDPTVREALKRVRETTLGAYERQDIPFEKLVEALAPERDLTREPFCQTLFIFERASHAAPQLPDLALTQFGQDLDVTRFEIELMLTESESAIGGIINYSTDLFEEPTIKRMAGHLKRLLEAMVKSPEKRIGQLNMLSAAEQHQIMEEWNDTVTEYPSDQCLHELFDRQVARTPDAIAVCYEDERVSYYELQRRADSLATLLTKNGVGRETTVGVLMDRGVGLLISILGVFKAGGVYVPFDLQHPIDRSASILRESKSKILLTSSKLEGQVLFVRDRLKSGEWPEILVMEEGGGKINEEWGPIANCDARDQAYVIYTSGSTGVPKGAVVEHRGMVNHIYAKIKTLKLDNRDTVAETASQCFDISIWQFLSALVIGGQTLIVGNDKAHDPSRLLLEVSEKQVAILEIVPSMLRLILEELEQPAAVERRLDGLRALVVTGEALPPELCLKWQNKYAKIPLVNAYGPTECSDDVTQEEVCRIADVNEARIPIGRALSNTRTYVIDAKGQQAPIGIEGELCIGGDGVGRGYFDNSAETAKSFIPDAYGEESGGRLYRTGDCARYKFDGKIEFLGRIDHQVKVRGYRIELGEVETALTSHPAIKEAVVISRKDVTGDQRLVGYFTNGEGAEPAISDLQAFLRKKLPEYMAPSALVKLDRIPLTPNGKLDRKALPEPESLVLKAAELEEPQTSLEKVVAHTWTEVLRIERVGVRQNFFELGGHSLLATQVVSRIREALQVDLPLRVLFENPTIVEFAEAIEMERLAGNRPAAPPIQPVNRRRVS